MIYYMQMLRLLLECRSVERNKVNGDDLTFLDILGSQGPRVVGEDLDLEEVFANTGCKEAASLPKSNNGPWAPIELVLEGLTQHVSLLLQEERGFWEDRRCNRQNICNAPCLVYNALSQFIKLCIYIFIILFEKSVFYV